MLNFTSKLKGFEKRLKKVPVIDPEEAIHTIVHFIELTGQEEDIPEAQVLDYSFFSEWVDKIISIEPEKDKPDKLRLWKEIEESIRAKHGFRMDSIDLSSSRKE